MVLTSTAVSGTWPSEEEASEDSGEAGASDTGTAVGGRGGSGRVAEGEVVDAAMWTAECDRQINCSELARNNNVGDSRSELSAEPPMVKMGACWREELTSASTRTVGGGSGGGRSR